MYINTFCIIIRELIISLPSLSDHNFYCNPMDSITEMIHFDTNACPFMAVFTGVVLILAMIYPFAKITCKLVWMFTVNERLWFLLLLGLYLTTGQAYAMQAYDCTAPDVTRFALDLTEPSDCPTTTSDFLPRRQERMQIIKTKANLQVVTAHCMVTISKTVTSCGFDSLSYGQMQTAWEEPEQMESEECWEAAHTGKVAIFGRSFIVTPGVQYSDIFFSHGYVSATGHCGTASFTSGGTYYANAYEQVTMTILISKKTGTWDQDRGLISFDSDVQGVFTSGELYDAYQGLYVWKPEQIGDTCEAGLTEFFRGFADMYSRRNNAPGVRGDDPTAPPRMRKGAVILLGHQELQGQHVGLLLGDPIRLCSKLCHMVASLRGYVVCFYRDGLPQMADVHYQKGQAAADLVMDDVKARSDAQHISLALYVHDKFENAARAICLVERKVAYNKLQAISGSQNPHALADHFGPGHLITPAGDSASYVTRCKPVTVRLAEYANCTLQVPVHVGNAPEMKVDPTTLKVDTESTEPVFFMSTLTKILQKYPTVITCSQLMPVMYKLNGRWFCSTPASVPCDPPMKLELVTGVFHVNANFTKILGTEGMVTATQWADSLQFMSENQHREAMEVKVSRTGFENARGGQMGSALTNSDVSWLSMGALSLFSPAWLIEWCGQYTVIVLGTMTMFTVTWTVVAALARAIRELCLHGCASGVLFRMLWALTGVITVPAAIGYAAAKASASAFPKMMHNLTGMKDAVSENNQKRAEQNTKNEETRLHSVLVTKQLHEASLAACKASGAVDHMDAETAASYIVHKDASNKAIWDSYLAKGSKGVLRMDKFGQLAVFASHQAARKETAPGGALHFEYLGEGLGLKQMPIEGPGASARADPPPAYNHRKRQAPNPRASIQDLDAEAGFGSGRETQMLSLDQLRGKPF